MSVLLIILFVAFAGILIRRAMKARRRLQQTRDAAALNSVKAIADAYRESRGVSGELEPPTA